MVSGEAIPSTETFRWYDAPPAGTEAWAPSQVVGDERTRFQAKGVEVTATPGESMAGVSLASLWQSVESQYVSVPLVIVYTCLDVPALIVQGAEPVFRMLNDSCGSTPALYVFASVRAATEMLPAVHGADPSVATVGEDAAGSAAGAELLPAEEAPPGAGVEPAAPLPAASRADVEPAVCVAPTGVEALPEPGLRMINSATTRTATSPRRTTARRRR